MHEYFAISVHFVVFYTVFNQKPWHFATFSRKIIRSRSYVPLTIALMRIITKLITFSSLNEQLSWLQVRKVRSNLVKAEMRVLQKTQKNLIIYYIKRSEILLIGVSGLFIF